MLTTWKCALVPLLFVATADGKDFRVLNLGDSCATVRAREAAQGSTEIKRKKGGAGLQSIVFRGSAFGRDLSLSYFCSDGGKGSLVAGRYDFPVEKLDRAVETYHKTYTRLIALYGKPSTDNSPWQQSEPRVQAPERWYLTTWRTFRVAAAMGFAYPSEAAGRRLYLTISVPLAGPTTD